MHFTADSCWLPSLAYAPSRIERKLLCFAMIHCFNAGQKCCSGINGGVCCSWSFGMISAMATQMSCRAVRSVRKCLPNLRPLLCRSLRRVWTDLQVGGPKWQDFTHAKPRLRFDFVLFSILFSCCRCGFLLRNCCRPIVAITSRPLGCFVIIAGHWVATRKTIKTAAEKSPFSRVVAMLRQLCWIFLQRLLLLACMLHCLPSCQPLAFALELCGAHVLEALSSLSNPAIQECEVLHLQQFELRLGVKLGTYQWSPVKQQSSVPL